MSDDWSGWIPILRVADARASKKFYTEALGFSVDWEHQFAEEFPLYLQLSRAPLALHLSEHEGGGIVAGDFFVRVPDVDAWHQTLVGRGVEPLNPPTDQEYGMRDFGVRDPDEHHITFGTPATFPTDDHREPVEGT